MNMVTVIHKKLPETRKKRSIIWQTPKEILENIVTNSTTFAEILSYWNLHNKGGNYQTLKRRLQEDDIDYSHIKSGLNANSGRNFLVAKIPLKEILIEKSSYSRTHLKRRLINENIIPYICSSCGQLPIWQNKPLVLVLDHENGIPDDNRLENLRFLCPNCNSQTETYCGKNKRKIL